MGFDIHQKPKPTIMMIIYAATLTNFGDRNEGRGDEHGGKREKMACLPA